MASRDRKIDALLAAARQRIEAHRPAEAVELLLQAAERAPYDAEVLENLAGAHHLNDQFIPALKIYDRMIDLGLATRTTWVRTGKCLTDIGEYAQAIGAYEQGLKLAPTDPEINNNLAQVCYRLGQVDRAAELLESAVRQSDDLVLWLNLATVIPSVPTASHQRVLEVRREFARRLAMESKSAPAAPERPGHFPQDATLPVAANKPLRIGYISAYFDNANYMKPVWGVINNHDRSRFEITLFSDKPLAKGMTGYRQDGADCVRETGDLDNATFAELIRKDRIDVLVDLNAYSTQQRLSLFLQRCAPVTIAWFNMYATSGLPAFDYIIGDDEVVHVEEEAFYSEQVLRLPVSYLTFEVAHPTPPVAAPPCLASGRLTFGSLVTQYKITPLVLDAWAEILRRTDGTSLLLANRMLKSPYNREFVVEQFARRGVDTKRLQLCGPAEHLAFLRYYDQMDIALDAFPYNGGTTTMEAIWQGVPVLTFDGDRWASRTSQTLLRRCHLGEFVAKDVRDMVETAVNLTHDPETPRRLGELRREMRDRLATSSACNTIALARGMEELYLRIWSERMQ